LHRDHPHEGEHEAEPHDDKDEHHAASVELSDEQLSQAGVELRKAGSGRVVVTVDLPGEIQLDAEALAHVGPRTPGAVREIKKKLGDEVKKGDVLAVLDSRDVAEMQGEVQAARERLALAEATFERKKKLFEEKITSEKEFLEAKHAHAEATVAVRSAERALAAQTGGRSSGAGYELVAPLSGTIVEWHIGLGEVLEEDSRAYTIADLTKVWVVVTVYAKDLPRVRVGQRALVRGEGIAAPVEASISFLSQTVGEVTRSAEARVVLASPGTAWRPGLFVTAEVEVDEADAPVVVAEEAIQRIEDEQVVFVREGTRVEARRVVTGRHGHIGHDQRVVEIVEGLKAGETYAAKNSFLIKAEIGKGAAGHEH
jgi:cobalt-zinc-cadmium efflux system membrane fusion protein